MNAVEALSKSLDAQVQALEAAQEVIVGLQTQLDSQQRVNAEVMNCLRFLMGVEKERPKLRLVALQSDDLPPSDPGDEGSSR